MSETISIMFDENGIAKEYDDTFDITIHCESEEEQNRVLEILNREEKTGHWIGHREHCENLGVMPSGLGAYEWCSNCDCGIDVREWHRNNYNFCPNCGARMVSE